MSAQQLTDSQLTAIQAKMEDLNLKIGSKEVTPDEALKQAYAQRDLLRETFVQGEVSELRRSTWTVVQDSIEVFRTAKNEFDRAAGPEFPAEKNLNIGATKRVNDVLKMIRQMTLNGQVNLTREEAYFAGKKRNGETYKEGDRVSVEVQARAHLSMLNNFGKYIDKDHPKLKDAWQKYNDKTIANYMEYAKDLTKRSQVRDEGFISKIKQNMDKYSDKNFAQAVLNLLEPKMPPSEPEKKQENKEDKSGTPGSTKGPRSRK
jgi:hypothetical protein